MVIAVNCREAALRSVLPELADGQALSLAVGIIGATVMPHAGLSVSLTQARIPFTSVTGT